jgi:hypothetical protein
MWRWIQPQAPSTSASSRSACVIDCATTSGGSALK